MPRAATNKTRMYSFAGVMVGIGVLTVDAWFSPPLPRVNMLVAALPALVFLHFANLSRQEGQEIPEGVMKECAGLAKTELLFQLLCVLGLVVALGMDFFGEPKPYLRAATVAALSMFAITVAVLWYVKVRFDAAMSAAGVAPGARK